MGVMIGKTEWQRCLEKFRDAALALKDCSQNDWMREAGLSQTYLTSLIANGPGIRVDGVKFHRLLHTSGLTQVQAKEKLQSVLNFVPQFMVAWLYMERHEIGDDDLMFRDIPGPDDPEDPKSPLIR